MLDKCGCPAAYPVETFDWRAVLWLGGLLPLAMLPLTIWLLPESIRYLVLKQKNPATVKNILIRIAPKQDMSIVNLRTSAQIIKTPMLALFHTSLYKGTLLLWLGFFMGLLAMFLLANWLPIMLEGMGISQKAASLIAMMFSAGGTTGAIVLGWLMDRFSQSKVLCVSYVMAGGFITLLGHLPPIHWLLASIVFMAGICLSGSQIGINALAAAFYPTDCRATGISWANSVGRLGSVLGSMAGGVMMSLQLTQSTIFLMTGIPTVITGLAMFAFSISFLRTGRSADLPAMGY